MKQIHIGATGRVIISIRVRMIMEFEGSSVDHCNEVHHFMQLFWCKDPNECPKSACYFCWSYVVGSSLILLILSQNGKYWRSWFFPNLGCLFNCKGKELMYSNSCIPINLAVMRHLCGSWLRHFLTFYHIQNDFIL